jgi:hypothetical protein
MNTASGDYLMILERNFWVTALALVCVFNSSQALADQNQSEVLAVADQALELITAENFAGLADLMLDDAITVSTALREGRHEVNLRTAAEQRASKPSVDIVERGFDPTVLISGTVAMTWYPYDIYIDGAWSHCGVDVFSMVRTDDGWRIASMTWSTEQPPACQPHPDGEPN